ncbi:acetylcholinesterase-like [Dermacentor andersoni]|uniref:acetylcholinesterase-like n=1 Tax=Dermacentor andersoni TaxID=34620 RepID=UPI003B3A9B27
MCVTRCYVLLLLVAAASCGRAYDVERVTRLGRVGGNRLELLGRKVEEYRGIPFAQPPVGRLRFLPPQPAKPWEGILDATSRRTACPQVVFSNFLAGEIEYTEDCLHLNVWSQVARDEDLAPVVVWIHGGGFTQGSASYDNYTGAALAAKTGLVVVTVNYRLGLLGFLDANSPEAPGNMGLLDQNLALKWIQENIREFGGDPSRVTIFGESAGGMSVHAHMLSPMSRGLFQRVYMMSGTLHTLDFFDGAHESIIKGDTVAAVVGCSGGDRSLASNPEAVIDCLRTKTADEILLAASEALAPKIFTFLPTYHNEFLPKVPTVAISKGFFNAADIVLGVTEDEGVLALMYPLRSELLPDDVEGLEDKMFKHSLHEGIFSWLKMNFPEMLEKYTADAQDKASLRRGYVDYISDSTFVCPMHFTAEKHAERGQNVYAYVFGHKSSKNPLPSWMGTPHAFDMNYIFGVPLIDQDRFDAEDADVSEVVLTALKTFAETGVPELPMQTPWPKYAIDSPVSVYIDYRNTTTIKGFRKEQCESWRSYL